MKSAIFLIFLLLISMGVGAQILEEVEVKPPQFVGVQDENYATDVTIEDYVADNMQYPSGDIKFKNEGTEVVMFTVGTDGKLSNFKIENSISREVDDEVIHVLRTTDGMWLPGQNNEGPVEMDRSVTIAFKISYDDNPKHLTDFKAMAEKYYKKGSTQLYAKNHAKRALRKLNQGITYLPYDAGLLVMRGYCKYTLGDEDGAVEDLKLVREESGMDNLLLLAREYKDMGGYAELIREIE